MEIRFTICKQCRELKKRIFDGLFDNKNKRWIDENGGLWSGTYCPSCNKNRLKSKMKQVRSTPGYVQKKYEKKIKIYSPEETETRRLKQREYNKNYMAKKLKTDINFKIAHNLRSRLYNVIKRNSKVGSAIKDLGCSIEDLKLYISQKFIENMTWDNYGEWEIDHIIPLNTFDLTDREQFLKACNYNNLQPLWKLDNRTKKKK